MMARIQTGGRERPFVPLGEETKKENEQSVQGSEGSLWICIVLLFVFNPYNAEIFGKNMEIKGAFFNLKSS